MRSSAPSRRRCLVSANPAVLDTFAADVVRDLQRQPKQLQARYLYDPLGSSLFDAICRLPWYRITRAEATLLQRHARDVAARLSSRERDVSLVELGCGNGEKLELLIAAMPREAHADVHLIDISVAALKATTRTCVALRPDQRLGTSRAPTNRGSSRCARSSSTIRERWWSSSARTSATSIRWLPTRCSARSASRWRAARCCCSAPISSSRRRSCCSPTTIRSA